MSEGMWIIVCLLASVGMVQGVGWLLCTLAKPKGCATYGYHILLLPHDPAQLENQLRYTILCNHWCGSIQRPILLLVDDGLDGEAVEICRKMTAKMSGVIFCAPQDLPAIVQTRQDLQIPQGTV